MNTVSSLQGKLWDVFNLYSVDVRSKYLGSDHNYDHYYSALDSIQDMSGALYEFSSIQRKPTLLECLGFLQCLVIQQDAVLLLSKIFGLTWDYDAETELVQIRDVRNRVVGHPNKAAKRGPKSTAFFPSQTVCEVSFEAVIQFKDKWKTESINFTNYLTRNEKALCQQLEKILSAAIRVEKKMFKQQPYETYIGGVKQER